jgi:septal ring factor EnvC (AmiA/AmiB activator)
MRYILTIVLFLSMLVGTEAQNIKAQKDRKAKLEREIAIIDKQLAANASKSSDMLSDLALIQKKIANRKDLIVESDKEIKSYSEKIAQKQAAIGRTQVRVDTLAAHYSRLVIGVYKNRDPRRWYMYVLASDNLGQAFRRMSYFRTLSTQLNADAQRLKTAQSELEQESQELQSLKMAAQDVRQQRQEELEKLAK